MINVIYIDSNGKKKSFKCEALDVRDSEKDLTCCVLTFLGPQVGTERKKRGKQTLEVPTHSILARAYGVTHYEVKE